MKNLKVKVQPKSSRSSLEKLGEGQYKAYLKSAPENNKANEELVGLLAEEFKLKRYQMKIVKGLTSRNKIISIDE